MVLQIRKNRKVAAESAFAHHTFMIIHQISTDGALTFLSNAESVSGGTYLMMRCPASPGAAAKLISDQSVTANSREVIEFDREMADDRTVYGGSGALTYVAMYKVN